MPPAGGFPRGGERGCERPVQVLLKPASQSGGDSSRKAARPTGLQGPGLRPSHIALIFYGLRPRTSVPPRRCACTVRDSASVFGGPTVTRSFVLVAALALAIPGAAFAQGGSGAGADVKANPTPAATPRPMPRMHRQAMSHGRSASSADRSADDLNAKELTSIQANQPGTATPSKP